MRQGPRDVVPIHRAPSFSALDVVACDERGDIESAEEARSLFSSSFLHCTVNRVPCRYLPWCSNSKIIPFMTVDGWYL